MTHDRASTTGLNKVSPNVQRQETIPILSSQVSIKKFPLTRRHYRAADRSRHHLHGRANLVVRLAAITLEPAPCFKIQCRIPDVIESKELRND